MAIDLRTVFIDDTGVAIDATILTNNSLQNQWDRALRYWYRYHTRPQSAIGVTIDSSLTYTFTDPIPYSIVTLYKLPTGDQVSCTDFYYSNPILTATEEGEYSVLYRTDMDITTMDEEDLPFKLRDLFVAYCKRATAQFLKFATYQDKPFEVDAQEWYTEAKEDIEKLEEHIEINRDERFENISNLTNQ